MLTMDLVKMHNKDAGHHFFDRETMRFFSSRLCATVHEGMGGVFFVTSEQRKGFECADGPRRYTVRRFNRSTGAVDTVGKFQGYPTSRAANRIAAKLASGDLREEPDHIIVEN
jgi:hypothetical protein